MPDRREQTNVVASQAREFLSVDAVALPGRAVHQANLACIGNDRLMPGGGDGAREPW